jgi:hypothetical protein
MQTENAVIVERSRCTSIWRAGVQCDQTALAAYLIRDETPARAAMRFIHSFEKRKRKANETES